MTYFIVNPVAGGGRARARVPEIEAGMRACGADYRIWTTAAPMDAKGLAARAVSEGAAAVVAVGGDGTVQETVSGLAGSGCLFGVIPYGSGNDFVKSVGISVQKSTAEYLNIIRGGRTRRIDLIKVNDFCFANIASIGIDARIVSAAEKCKKALGRFSYMAAALYCTLTCGPTRMTVIADGREYTRDFALAAVCNGWNYGGGFKIAPSAKNDDGYITLCLIDAMSKAEMTVLFPSVMSAKHVKLKQVHFIECKKVEIHFDGTQIANLDGNLYEMRGPLVYEVMPSALRVPV